MVLRGRCFLAGLDFILQGGNGSKGRLPGEEAHLGIDRCLLGKKETKGGKLGVGRIL